MRRVLGTNIPEDLDDVVLPREWFKEESIDAYNWWLASVGRASLLMIDDLEKRLQRLREKIAELKGIDASQVSQWP